MHPDNLPAFVRAFVAVEIGEEVRARLAETQTRLKKSGARVSWVLPQNMHLSLAFLGDVGRDAVLALGPALDEAVKPFSPFSFEVADLGSFGGALSPRVIWAGMRDTEQLLALQAGVADAVRAVGLPLEDREFKPHLTIGRVRASQGRDALVEAVESVGEIRFGRVDVAGIVLMRSVLRPGGPEYSALHRSDFPASRG
jgi:2'-5' RNA ligase